MFTGLIQQVGRMERVNPRGEGAQITIRHAPWDVPLALGESVSVNGVCLTVAGCDHATFRCDALRETLQRTNLGSKGNGEPVNLERALRVGDRLGGHIITGHVDGTGTVRAVEPAWPDRVIEIACDAALMRGIIHKGSVACDGVSLTIAWAGDSSFKVHIIPVTWECTALSRAGEGSVVNLETDMIGKYVLRYMENVQPPRGVTLDDLRNAGFLA